MPRVRAGLECKQAGGDPVVRLQVPDLPQQIQKRSKTMRNEVIYDKNGRPDIMVVFTPSELGLPDTLRVVIRPGGRLCDPVAVLQAHRRRSDPGRRAACRVAHTAEEAAAVLRAKKVRNMRGKPQKSACIPGGFPL